MLHSEASAHFSIVRLGMMLTADTVRNDIASDVLCG